MSGCQICCPATMIRCPEGERLCNEVVQRIMESQASSASAIAHARVHQAHAAYHEHLHGSWDDEPDTLTADEPVLCGFWPWTGPEWAGLLRTSQKHRAEIVSRRAGMHQR